MSYNVDIVNTLILFMVVFCLNKITRYVIFKIEFRIPTFLFHFFFFPGVFLHEFAHAIFATLLKRNVKGFLPYNPLWKRSGVMGQVTHIGPLNRPGISLVSLAPFIVCVPVGYFLAKYLFGSPIIMPDLSPGYISLYGQALSYVFSELLEFEVVFLFSFFLLGSIATFWTPSKTDLKNSIVGLIMLAIFTAALVFFPQIPVIDKITQVVCPMLNMIVWTFFWGNIASLLVVAIPAIIVTVLSGLPYLIKFIRKPKFQEERV